MTELTVLRTPLTANDWRALGLAQPRAGAVVLAPGPPGWAFTSTRADVLPIPTWQAAAPEGEPPAHPATVTRIDHVVFMAPSLDDASEWLRVGLDLEPRRLLQHPGRPPMAFYRCGDAVLEVVESGGPPRLWGVALRVDDMDAAVAAAGGLLGDPHPAVQGGRMASATRQWDGFAVGFYSPA